MKYAGKGGRVPYALIQRKEKEERKGKEENKLMKNG